MTAVVDKDAVRRQRYQDELPEDHQKAWKLLEQYSKIAPDEIETHLRAVRERAWNIYPYGCIGAWRFLDLYITELPIYPEVVARLQAGDRLLDAGCCFGYVLRQLVADGAPASHLAGTDLQQDFIDMGYELFRDRDTFGGRIVAGNLLYSAPESGAGSGDPRLADLDASFDIVHAASFFHLFEWDGQVQVGERIVRFLRPRPSTADAAGASKRTAKPRLLFGRQLGHPQAGHETTISGMRRYLHSVESLQKLWEEIGERTGTRWKVEATLTLSERTLEVGKDRHLLHFVIEQLDGF